MIGNHLKTRGIKGNGRLVVLSSEDSCRHESPKGNKMRVSNDICLAIIQSIFKADIIKFEVSSLELKSTIIDISSY